MSKVIQIAPVLICLLVHNGTRAYQYDPGLHETHRYTSVSHLPRAQPPPPSHFLCPLLPPHLAKHPSLITFCRARGSGSCDEGRICQKGSCCVHNLTLGPLTSPFISASNVLGFGMSQKVGHLDFFPNGGKEMPGCQKNILSTVIDIDGIWEGM